MNTDTFFTALKIAGVGLLGVYLFMFIFLLIIIGLHKFFPGEKQPNSENS